MRYPTRSRNNHFDIGKLNSKITMNELAKTGLFVHPWEHILFCPVTIGHDPVMCAYDTGKKAKTQNALPVFMLHAFVVDQGGFFVQYRPEKSPVIWLHLTGMGKE